MSRLTRRFFCLAVLAVSISLLAACQKTTPSTPDLPDLKVGVVGVEQPKGTTDLLAGFIPEDRVLASDQAVATFNEELMKLLKTTTHRSYVFIPKAGGADPRERRFHISACGLSEDDAQHSGPPRFEGRRRRRGTAQGDDGFARGIHS